MLPHLRRIRRIEIPLILRASKRYFSSHILLSVAHFSSEGSTKYSKFSFSVSKKVCSNAVDRNKLRRRGYSVVGKNLTHIKPGYLCLFSFKAGSESVEFVDLEKEIIELLSSATMLL